jgi:hypothetical protein
MATKEHRELANYIIGLIGQINPHTQQEGRIGYVYALGFLASYLASLAEEDPWILKRYVKHVKALKQTSKTLNHKQSDA